MFAGMPELPATIERLPVVFRQRDYGFYPAWAYTVSMWLIKLPLGLADSILWTVIIYFLVGMTPSASQYDDGWFLSVLFCDGCGGWSGCVWWVWSGLCVMDVVVGV